jgi:plasmid stabilization system protein ParE
VPSELRWRPQARPDLIEIYMRIDSEHPAAAERIFDAIQARLELLAHFPM